MVSIGERIRILYDGQISDILIVDHVDGDRVWLLREETHNSCGVFNLNDLDIVAFVDDADDE